MPIKATNTINAGAGNAKNAKKNEEKAKSKKDFLVK